MDPKTFLFYLFAAITVVSALRVVTARNPVHAALFLVLTFCTAAAIWMLLKAEFLAITLVLVYVGAVMVLFLFVVMMLDINLDQMRQGFWRNLPVALFVGVVVVLELAIVELVPSHAVISAVGLIAPFAQAPALAVASKIAGKGTSVAIEGRLRDSVTGEVLMMFADREEPPFRIISLKAITWYGDAEDSIETWSKQLVELANTPKTKKVEDASNFTLLPW